MKHNSVSEEIAQDKIIKSKEETDLKEFMNSLKDYKMAKKDISEEIKKTDENLQKNLEEYFKKIDNLEEKLNSILSDFINIKKGLAEPIIDKAEKLETLEKKQTKYEQQKQQKSDEPEISDGSKDYEDSGDSENSWESKKQENLEILDKSENSVNLEKQEKTKKKDKKEHLEEGEKNIKSENKVKKEKDEKNIKQNKQEQPHKAEKSENFDDSNYSDYLDDSVKTEYDKKNNNEETSNKEVKTEKHQKNKNKKIREICDHSDESDNSLDLRKKENLKNVIKSRKFRIKEKLEKLINMEIITKPLTSEKSNKPEKTEIIKKSKQIETNGEKFNTEIIVSENKRIKRLPQSFQIKKRYAPEENQFIGSGSQKKEPKNVACIRKARSAIYMSEKKNEAIFKSMEENGSNIHEKSGKIKHKIVGKSAQDRKIIKKKDFFDGGQKKYLEKSKKDKKDKNNSDNSSEIEKTGSVRVNLAKQFEKSPNELSEVPLQYRDGNTTKDNYIKDPTKKDENYNNNIILNIPVNFKEKILIQKELLDKKCFEKPNSSVNDLDVYASINETLAQMIGEKPIIKKNNNIFYNKTPEITKNINCLPKTIKNTKIKVDLIEDTESKNAEKEKEYNIIKKISATKIARSALQNDNKNKAIGKEEKLRQFSDLKKPIIVDDNKILCSSFSASENIEKVEKSENKENNAIKIGTPKESLENSSIKVIDSAQTKPEENRCNSTQIIKKNSQYYRDLERKHQPSINNKLIKENIKEWLPLHNIDNEKIYVDLADDYSLNSKSIISPTEKKQSPYNISREWEKNMINKLLKKSINKSKSFEIRENDGSNNPNTDSWKKVENGKSDNSSNSSISDKFNKSNSTETNIVKKFFKLKERSKSHTPKQK